MKKSTMESASWQRPLHGFEISQNQAKMSLESGVLGRPGGVTTKRQAPMPFCQFLFFGTQFVRLRVETIKIIGGRDMTTLEGINPKMNV